MIPLCLDTADRTVKFLRFLCGVGGKVELGSPSFPGSVTGEEEQLSSNTPAARFVGNMKVRKLEIFLVRSKGMVFQ